MDLSTQFARGIAGQLKQRVTDEELRSLRMV
jgi:hypothetical protein